MSPSAVAFTYQIVTPDGSFASGVCEFLVVPTSRGEIGILANHEPLLSDIVAGAIRISRAGTTERYHLGKGILELAGNSVTLLVEEAATRIEDSPSGGSGSAGA